MNASSCLLPVSLSQVFREVLWQLAGRTGDDTIVICAAVAHKSQSSVSYNLALLQERLGVALLVPEGRRAVLTPAGELLLQQVKPLLKAFSYVETRASTMRNGMRTRLDLVVDSIFPRSHLFAILRQFQLCYPQTQVHLTEAQENVALPAHTEADVMILPRRQDMTGRGEWLMNVDFIAVAHRDHPLFTLSTMNDETLSAWPLIRIAGSDSAQQSTSEAWTFSTIDAAIEAVMYQVGYGWLPEERIREQLEAGILKMLPLSHGLRRATPLHLIVKKDLMPLDEQVKTLLKLLTSAK